MTARAKDAGAPSKRLGQLRTALLAAVLAVICLAASSAMVALSSTHGGSTAQQGRLPGALLTGSRRRVAAAANASWDLSLSRPPQAVALERLTAKNAQLGLCQDQESLLPDVLAQNSCRDLQCMWSDAAASNVDLWLNPLQLLQQDVLPGMCEAPRGGQLPLRPGSDPLVSFVVTMHNNAAVTAQCLLELFRTASEAESAEYIVVNDGSTHDIGVLKETAARLRALFGVHILVLDSKEAEGFGAANTRGVDAARGTFIAFINNDMFAIRGWLAPLLATFKLRPEAGMVGPMFMGMRGKIQEAGGIVYNDAHAGNHGRDQWPNHHFTALRRADYVSAACVVLRRATFLQVGGFDPQYRLGYYEDTDLAMAVRAAGQEVLVQPLAVVYHQEGGTFGTDASSALKRELMEENRAKFRDKWRAVLEAVHCRSSVGVLAAASRQETPSLLWVDDALPEPERDSASIRTLHMMKVLLRKGYRVSFIPLAPQHPRFSAMARLRGITVLPGAKPSQWHLKYRGACMYHAVIVARRALYNTTRAVVDRQCPGVPVAYSVTELPFWREAREAVSRQRPAGGGPGALRPSSQKAAAGDEEQAQRSPWEFAAPDVGGASAWLDSGLLPAVEVARKRDAELSLVDRSAAVLVGGEAEAAVLRRYRPSANIHVVPPIREAAAAGEAAPLPEAAAEGGPLAWGAERQGVGLAGAGIVPGASGAWPCERRSGLLFVGNLNYPPNWLALESLMEDVMPLLAAKLSGEGSGQEGEVLVHVAGTGAPPGHLVALFERHRRSIHFHGYLPEAELRVLYDRARVAVAPILSGSGIRGKALQAMELGVPLVATPLAVEGMDASDGRDCLLATTPAAFAAQLWQAYSNCTLWRSLAAGARRTLQQRYSPQAVQPALLAALASIGAPARDTVANRSSCHPNSGEPGPGGSGRQRPRGHG